jgi:hypothetical protein
MMRNKWTQMVERRGRTRGEEQRGQSSRSTDARTQEIERKRKETEDRQTVTRKRKHGETPTPRWARRDIEIEVGTKNPMD